MGVDSFSMQISCACLSFKCHKVQKSLIQHIITLDCFSEGSEALKEREAIIYFIFYFFAFKKLMPSTLSGKKVWFHLKEQITIQLEPLLSLSPFGLHTCKKWPI